MSLYHIGKNGPSPCRAKTPERCPLNEPGEHFEELKDAAAHFESLMPAPAPAVRYQAPLPQKFYHVTRTSALSSILDVGLQPKIGSLSADLGETVEQIYLFDSMESLEDALGGWLGEELDEDAEYSVLSVDGDKVSSPKPSFDDPEGSWEWTTADGIDASLIQVEDYEV